MKKKRVKSEKLGNTTLGAFEAFLGQLRDGNLRPGDRLPPERQLSEQLGISRLTLGNVLGKLEDEGWVQSISPKIRAVSSQANRFRRKQSRTIAVITSNAASQGEQEDLSWAPSYGTRILELIQQQSFSLLILPPQLGPEEITHRLVEAAPKGVVLLNAFESEVQHEVQTRFEEAGITCVACSPIKDATSGEPLMNYVCSDHFEGARRMTHWLWNRGSRRIQLVSMHSVLNPPNWWEDRIAGYEKACQELNSEPLPPIVVSADIRSRNNRERFELKVRMAAGFLCEYVQDKVVAQPTDGLICVSEGSYPAIASACRLLKREPQKDIFISGYDSHWAQHWEIPWEPSRPLALIDKQDEQIARGLIDLLLLLSSDDKPSLNLQENHPQRVLVEPLVREWTSVSL